MKNTYQKTIGCALGLLMFALLPVIGQSSEASSFVGDWANKDFQTRSFTRVQIRLEGSNVIAHVWARCQPTECDWGNARATVKGQTLSLTWNQVFAVETQELTLLADGSLQMTGHRHFTDSSGRKDYDSKDIFAKGLVHDWSEPSTAISSANDCINRLRQIDAAANEFALEKGKTKGEAINYPDDLTPYIKLDSAGEIPPCPSGGIYTIKKVNDKPTCSLGTTVTPAHVLP
jgi:hypothetical protein